MSFVLMMPSPRRWCSCRWLRSVFLVFAVLVLLAAGLGTAPSAHAFVLTSASSLASSSDTAPDRASDPFDAPTPTETLQPPLLVAPSCPSGCVHRPDRTQDAPPVRVAPAFASICFKGHASSVHSALRVVSS